MIRSFDHRVLGGVCGGLGMALRINPWFFRVSFVILTAVNGVMGLGLYLAFWWAMPQQSFINATGAGFLQFLFLAFTMVVIVGGWLYSRTGGLVSPSGQDLYLPVVLLLLSLIFLIRQLRT